MSLYYITNFLPRLPFHVGKNENWKNFLYKARLSTRKKLIHSYYILWKLPAENRISSLVTWRWREEKNKWKKCTEQWDFKVHVCKETFFFLMSSAFADTPSANWCYFFHLTQIYEIPHFALGTRTPMRIYVSSFFFFKLCLWKNVIPVHLHHNVRNCKTLFKNTMLNFEMLLLTQNVPETNL